MTAAISKNVLSKLFSDDLFKHRDTESLLKQFSVGAVLRDFNRLFHTAKGYTPQNSPDITDIPAGGILIEKPGTYRFTADLAWNPTKEGSAILVLADNVTIDLNGFALTVNAPDNKAHYNGITLGMTDYDITACNSLTVTNGRIHGATYYGISAFQVKGLHLHDLTIGDMSYEETEKAYLTACGIFIDATENFKVESCTIQNISVLAPSCAGIQVVSSMNGSVSDCTIRELLNDDGGVQGFSYLKSTGIVTERCISRNFRSHNKGITVTTGHTVIGYVPIFCWNLVYNDCAAESMTGCCDDCHGISVFIDADVEVNRFRATNIVDGDCSVMTGAKATGVEVYGTNITVSDCVADTILAIVPQDLQSAGFSAWGTNITFNNCSAHNVQVLDANRQPTLKHGYGTGFGWAPDPRDEFKSTPAKNTQYNNCRSHDCQLGFDTWYHTNSSWNNVMSYNCPVFILAQPFGTQRTFGMDRCSESPTGKQVSVTISNIAENNTYPEIITGTGGLN